MVNTIEFKGSKYPAFQATGFASRFAFPFAQEVCKGTGFDIGYSKEEWKFPGAIGVEPCIDDRYNALRVPEVNGRIDYIFSSHCLEHIPNWVEVLDYWYDILDYEGVLFLYLPDFSQQYWRPWHNRKHVNCFTPEIIHAYMADKGYKNIFCSGIDLNNSFIIFGEK
jgi:SAM-dependent methyltransferase